VRHSACIPAFTLGKSQLPPEDVERTRKIANVGIHVERVIGSVRQRYKILSATTPLPMEYTRSKNCGPILLNSIVCVCCALHNVILLYPHNLIIIILMYMYMHIIVNKMM
jgi:hypothetical protein